jgi:hypothetical protein
MINTGFVMLKRDILDWEWYTDVITCKIFLHCLLKVNYSQKEWRGTLIKKGEFITSYEKLAVETGLTVSKVRTALSKLEKTNHLSVEATTTYTKVHVPKLRDFIMEFSPAIDGSEIDKPNDKPNDNQFANKPQSNRNQITTTNTNKITIKNRKNRKNRKNKFRDEVFALSKFDSKILDSFFKYWSELNSDKTKMHFEKHEYFEIEKRLERWLKNEFKKSKVSKIDNELLTNR